MSSDDDDQEARLTVEEIIRDPQSHSRACGFRRHPHGEECSRNCPTCYGQPVPHTEQKLSTRQSATRTEVLHRFACPENQKDPRVLNTILCYYALAEFLVDGTPGGRTQALALTALEESMLWSIAGFKDVLLPSP